MESKTVFRLLAATVLLMGSAAADQIAVGTLQFSQNIPQGEEPAQGVGTNAFFVINLSGLFPDEPELLSTPGVFTNAFLTLYSGPGGGTSISVGTLASGAQFISDLFPASTQFTSAVFTGVMDELNWTLFGELSHSDGSPLLPGEFAPVYALFEPPNQGPAGVPLSSVPEPSTLALFGSGVGLIVRRFCRGS